MPVDTALSPVVSAAVVLCEGLAVISLVADRRHDSMTKKVHHHPVFSRFRHACEETEVDFPAARERSVFSLFRHTFEESGLDLIGIIGSSLLRRGKYFSFFPCSLSDLGLRVEVADLVALILASFGLSLPSPGLHLTIPGLSVSSTGLSLSSTGMPLHRCGVAAV